MGKKMLIDKKTFLLFKKFNSKFTISVSCWGHGYHKWGLFTNYKKMSSIIILITINIPHISPFLKTDSKDVLFPLNGAALSHTAKAYYAILLRGFVLHSSISLFPIHYASFGCIGLVWEGEERKRCPGLENSFLTNALII